MDFDYRQGSLFIWKDGSLKKRVDMTRRRVHCLRLVQRLVGGGHHLLGEERERHDPGGERVQGRGEHDLRCRACRSRPSRLIASGFGRQSPGEGRWDESQGGNAAQISPRCRLPWPAAFWWSGWVSTSTSGSSSRGGNPGNSRRPHSRGQRTVDLRHPQRQLPRRVDHDVVHVTEKVPDVVAGPRGRG